MKVLEEAVMFGGTRTHPRAARQQRHEMIRAPTRPYPSRSS